MSVATKQSFFTSRSRSLKSWPYPEEIVEENEITNLELPTFFQARTDFFYVDERRESDLRVDPARCDCREGKCQICVTEIDAGVFRLETDVSVEPLHTKNRLGVPEYLVMMAIERAWELGVIASQPQRVG